MKFFIHLTAASRYFRCQIYIMHMRHFRSEFTFPYSVAQLFADIIALRIDIRQIDSQFSIHNMRYQYSFCMHRNDCLLSVKCIAVKIDDRNRLP